MIEFTEIMRQKDDFKFTELSNRLRTQLHKLKMTSNALSLHL